MNMQLPDAVLAILGGAPFEQMPLGTETTNKLWRLNHAWVWRQFCPAPGVDRQREAQFMQAGAHLSWMPPVHLWHAQGMLMPWLEGKSLGTLLPAHRERLLNCCLELWQQPIEGLPRWNYAALVADYAAQAGAAHAPLAEHLLQQVQQWPQATPCWVHHDLHAGNLLWHADGLWVLDWEFAGLGNPWLDAVCLDRWVHWQPEEWAQLDSALAPWQWLGAEAYADWMLGLERLWFAAQSGPHSTFGGAALCQPSSEANNNSAPNLNPTE